jgi:hypothetical protein
MQTHWLATDAAYASHGRMFCKKWVSAREGGRIADVRIALGSVAPTFRLKITFWKGGPLPGKPRRRRHG